MIQEEIFTQLTPQPYDSIREKINIGDLILCSGNGLISSVIKEATGSVFSHVGLLLRLPVTDQWLVLESVEDIGVRCVTLVQGYLKNYDNSGKGYDGNIVIARHQAMQSKFKFVESLYARAFEFLGDKYSSADIFKIATRIALNKVGVHEDGIVKEDNCYICSEYVYACLKAVGISLPYNPLGFIAPADIARNPDVFALAHLDLKNHQAVRPEAELSQTV